MNKLFRYPVLALFAATILGMAAANLVVPARAHSEMENRFLNQRPAFSLKALLDSGKDGFAQRYEAYVNDQFVGRDGWITLKSMSEAALGKVENNGIVYGADGQMFEKHTALDRQRLERNIGLLTEFALLYPELSKRVMLVPGAYDVLTDKVPTGLNNVEGPPFIEEAYRRWDAVGLRGVDVTPALRGHAGEYIYYRTDHHWTTWGARVAYEVYADAVGIPPARLEGVPANTVEDFYGTSYSKSKHFSALPDIITWYDVDVDGVLVDAKPVGGLYDLEKFGGRDKYAAFLHGNNGVTVIENADAPSRSILVIKDSYANCFAPFLTQSFSRVVVVDLRSMTQKLSELIAAESFQEVLILYSFTNLASDANLPRIKY